MKIIIFKDHQSWLAARRGKITGSKTGDVITKRGTGFKIGVYQLIAERLGIPPDDENPMERGHRLEPEAVARFQKETGKKMDTSLVMWVREDDESIGYSPDAFKGVTEAVEVKCLASRIHIEAFCTQQVPDEHKDQVIQAFVVNDKLRILYFVLYDPRVEAKDFFYLTVKRADVQEDVSRYLIEEARVLQYVRDMVNQITF